MTNTPSPLTTTAGRRIHPVAELLLRERHPLVLSLALHLVPGALITAVYLLFAEPFVLSVGYPPFLAWAIALTAVLGPLLLGLYWLGHQRNGRLSLRGVLHYTGRPISRGKLTALIAALIVWMTVVSLALVPMDNWFYDQFFTWIQYKGAGGSATTYLDGYSRTAVLVTLVVCLPFTGFSLPLVEELYFRGFLLPRLPQLGRWAPLVNTVLFTVYHFWSPWTYLSKVIFLFPAVWLVWRKHDLRISIGMHPGTALLMASAGIIALALGVI
ncbi:CPBP family intramembrane glutamic endopeptidase [Myceligenerans indicum]|uniref:CPBP family intramembrane metalloprotease n=1 Tax=Myceligenerans indicum TaxID=2593663 RepID=A0ABS1LH78_9MICO|nr:CPBP family intramembrane glutamic endopeptidase [Myceligenerans indicum]MBL0885503.1 CPBP family intramembrane metalloprotease [Myceligenerans indicum]